MFAAAPESSAPTVVRVAALAPTKVTEMQSGDVEFVMVLRPLLTRLARPALLPSSQRGVPPLSRAAMRQSCRSPGVATAPCRLVQPQVTSLKRERVGERDYFCRWRDETTPTSTKTDRTSPFAESPLLGGGSTFPASRDLNFLRKRSSGPPLPSGPWPHQVAAGYHDDR